MTGSAQLHAPLESSLQEAAAPLESILCTEELQSRLSRPPDHEKENAARVALCSARADSPRTILQTLADEVLDALGADSAGLSLLTKDGKRFYWAAIAGAWGPHIGGGTPRDFGPRGDVLDHNTPMLTTKTDGMGIGLSVSRSIIESIMAASGPSRTMARVPPSRFRIPSVQTASPTCHRNEVLMERNPSLVSVVDDDESVRESLPDLLRCFGFDADAFSSAEAFLASNAVSETSCLLLDIAMPGMSGPDLQGELKRRRVTLPIVFITGDGDRTVRPMLLERGAVECLLKPFSEAALLDAIRAALPPPHPGG